MHNYFTFYHSHPKDGEGNVSRGPPVLSLVLFQSGGGGGVSLVLSMVLLGEQEGEVPRQDGGTPPQDSTTDRTGGTPLSR